jgi:hypothetical protein
MEKDKAQMKKDKAQIQHLQYALKKKVRKFIFLSLNVFVAGICNVMFFVTLCCNVIKYNVIKI